MATLRRYVLKVKGKRDEIDWNSPILEAAPRLQLDCTVNKIFSSDEEEVVSNNFQTTVNLLHDLNPKCAIKLAYDLAFANSKKVRPSWVENETTSRVWFNAFSSNDRNSP
ncbi:hypothetical protein HHI36_017209 [Cryptolaemus montrouzieri]|uniref:Uncharacterized protein n=1 Tax=Cryptolaemus montrouzieri TaxID=559131 RepID=A0ABD2NLV6_9CUCU